MSHTLSVKLSDEDFANIEREARIAGVSAADWLSAIAERQCSHGGAAQRARRQLTPAEARAANERLRRHFGEVSVPDPTGLDNDAIDADLAREYGDTHEEP